jgi:ubiquinone biosynthesis accessory factor UbiJ
MPIEPLLTATIESALNRLIQDDPALVRRLMRLKGQVIQIHVKELDRTLTFLFSQQIDVLAGYEGKANCYLSLHLSILPELLREKANITALIKQDKLVLEGDLQLAQAFAQLMNDCKPDVEEWLSRLTGDVVAHTVVGGARGVTQLIKQHVCKQQNYLAQVITQEWKLAPGPLEVAYFCDQVADVNDKAQRLDKRLNSLMETV